MISVMSCFQLFNFDLVWGQSKTEVASSDTMKDETTEMPTITTLKSLLRSMQDLENDLKELKTKLKAAEIDEQKIKITAEINQLAESLDAHKKDFERISVGVDLDQFGEKPEQDFDWEKEVLELLSPVLQELKNMTAQPRQLERLRSEVAHYKNKLLIVKKAIVNIQNLIDQTKDDNLKDRLSNLKKRWMNEEQQISNQLTVAKYRLEEKNKGKKSLLDSTQNILRIFFKSRGRNLFLFIASFILVFLILRLFYQLVYKFSPILKSKERSFYVRLGEVLYHIMTFVGAVSVSLIVLYGSGDWVLLSLAIIFMIGLAWTAKQGLPRFWEQIKLLLNLGTVRENERVIYKGLPWKVVSINLYSHLENPALKSSRIRLPLRGLIELNSRPYHSDEPWFPCKENDWVILEDGTHGKVTTQTADIVRLVLLGGSYKTYLTEEFLKQNPNNISTNFRLRVTFGIDYRHQKISTQEIPEKLEEMLTTELTRDGYGRDIINLAVEFKEAGASSLDHEILADFSGKVAQYYNVLDRAIQRIAVDACNKYGWVIPFTQLTLHTAKE
jgi:hypothetical protein